MSSRSLDSPLSADGNTLELLSSRYTVGHVDHHDKSRKEQQDNVSGSDFKGDEQQMSAIENQNPDPTSSSCEDSYQSSLTPLLPSMPHKRLDIRNHEGVFDIRKLLQSGVRIPLYLPPMLVLPLLTRANIGHARILLLEKQINRLEDGDNPSLAAQVHEKDKDRERETLQKKKESSMYQMLTNAREAIDIADLLRRPDLQARGFWYLAIAAREEGNEHLWESYLEKCLEAGDSLEGRAAAEELGIHENEDAYEGRRVGRSSIFCEEAQSEADKEKMRNGVLGVDEVWRLGCEFLSKVWT